MCPSSVPDYGEVCVPECGSQCEYGAACEDERCGEMSSISGSQACFSTGLRVNTGVGIQPRDLADCHCHNPHWWHQPTLNSQRQALPHGLRCGSIAYSYVDRPISLTCALLGAVSKTVAGAAERLPTLMPDLLYCRPCMLHGGTPAVFVLPRTPADLVCKMTLTQFLRPVSMLCQPITADH